MTPQIQSRAQGRLRWAMSPRGAGSLTGKRAPFARFLACAHGNAAVEFAMIFPLLIGTLLAGFALAYVFLARVQLDQATAIGMRAVQVESATTQAQVQSAICNAIGGILDCNKVIFNLNTYASLSSINTSSPTLTYNGSGAVTNASSATFGAQGSIMVLQVVYPLPMISGPLFNFATQSNGTLQITSTQVFVQE